MEGPQLQQPLALEYALHVGDEDPYALADTAWLPLLVVDAPGGGRVEPQGTALDIAGAEVSAVVREGGALTVRVFNPTDETTTVELGDQRGWLVDLRGRPLVPFEGSFVLAPHAIATARLGVSG
jgi:hypothetical protein